MGTVARIIEQSVAGVIEDGSPRAYDMGGTASTHDVARAVAQRAAALAEHPATEEKIDQEGTKIEELAGTGITDTQG